LDLDNPIISLDISFDSNDLFNNIV